MSTVWLTVLVSVERYVAICRPLDVASVCTVSRVRRAVLAILVVSVLFNVPRYVEVRIDVTGTRLEKTVIGSSEYFRYTYTCFLYSMTLFIVPLVLLIFLNVRLVMALHKGRAEWVNLQVVQRREQTLTAIPLTIVLVFFVCGTPSLAVNVIDSIDPYLLATQTFYVSFMLFANFLVVVNSASNIIVYCLVGTKFRSKLMEILQCKTCGYRQKAHSDGLTSTGGASLQADWSSVEHAMELPSGTLKRALQRSAAGHLVTV
jgi:hypothetical protein